MRCFNSKVNGLANSLTSLILIFTASGIVSWIVRAYDSSRVHSKRLSPDIKSNQLLETNQVSCLSFTNKIIIILNISVKIKCLTIYLAKTESRSMFNLAKYSTLCFTVIDCKVITYFQITTKLAKVLQ